MNEIDTCIVPNRSQMDELQRLRMQEKQDELRRSFDADEIQGYRTRENQRLLKHSINEMKLLELADRLENIVYMTDYLLSNPK